MNKILKSLLMFMVAVSIEATLPVTLYYESLCSDSIYFITRQLYPNYELFKDKITLDLVPYGKALHSYNASTGNYTFTCQHGRDECMGNKYQACGLAQIDNPDTKLNFITCVMSTVNPAQLEYLKGCAEQYKVNYRKLVSCSLSRDGDKLLAAYGNKTQKLEPNLYFVPTLVLNNSVVINSDDQDHSQKDFKDFMCNKLSDKPDSCNVNPSFLRSMKNFFS